MENSKIEWTHHTRRDIVHSLWEIKSVPKSQQLQKLECHTKNGKPNKPKANRGAIAANNGSQSLLLAATNQEPMDGHPHVSHASALRQPLGDTVSLLKKLGRFVLEMVCVKYADALKSSKSIIAMIREASVAFYVVGAMEPWGNSATMKSFLKKQSPT